MPTPRWKLSDEQSLDSLNYDDASSLGEFFATAIAEGTGAKTSPRKAKYNRFRTTFWEEPLYNPEIAHGHINHAHDYLEKEQKKAWTGRGHQWSLSSDVRFRDNAYINPGPQKPERFPHCFEKPHKYWGRERKINPYARAKVYTRPNDRCKPWAKLVIGLYGRFYSISPIKITIAFTDFAGGNGGPGPRALQRPGRVEETRPAGVRGRAAVLFHDVQI